MSALVMAGDNLALRDLTSGKERQLTNDGTAEYAYGAPPAAMRKLTKSLGIDIPKLSGRLIANGSSPCKLTSVTFPTSPCRNMHRRPACGRLCTPTEQAFPKTRKSPNSG